MSAEDEERDWNRKEKQGWIKGFRVHANERLYCFIL